MTVFSKSLGRVAVAAGAVLVLGGSAVGIAAAQSTPTPAPTAQPTGTPGSTGQQQGRGQQFIDALAKRLGISSQQLQTDISQARQDVGLPANGGSGPGGGAGGARMGFRGFDLQAAASAIGITPQQLMSELPGSSLAQVASNHGKSASDVVNALTSAADTRIDQAVSSGRLTSDQANTQKTNVANRINQLVNQVMPQRGQGGGPGGPGGQGGGQGQGGPGRGPGGFGFGPGVLQQGLNVAAQTLGISPQQLQSELQGKSLAQVASDHGKSGADVATALKNAANAMIDQAVSNGSLTADQANTQKTNIDNRIDQLVNQVLPQGVLQRGGSGGQQQGQTGA